MGCRSSPDKGVLPRMTSAVPERREIFGGAIAQRKFPERRGRKVWNECARGKINRRNSRQMESGGKGQDGAEKECRYRMGDVRPQALATAAEAAALPLPVAQDVKLSFAIPN